MKLKLSLILALVITLVATVFWEIYWRNQGRLPNIDDNKNLWANQRDKLDKPNENDVTFIGSSRILYAIQSDIWEEETQTKPIMLAAQGGSPIPVFKDIVDNTAFSGTLIVGITPALFFSTLHPQVDFIKRPQFLVDYHKKRTYAQRINHALAVPLQKNFTFIRDGDEAWDSDVDLKTLISHIYQDERGGPIFPPFNNFEDISLDRHMKMPKLVETDTAYANSIKKVWTAILSGDYPPPDVDGTISAFVELSKTFRERGGNLILVRCPSDGLFRERETQDFPRKTFWDRLLIESNSKGYHYLDYQQFHNLFLPEWSHLATSDAQFFTRELIKLMKADNVISNSKSN